MAWLAPGSLSVRLWVAGSPPISIGDGFSWGEVILSLLIVASVGWIKSTPKPDPIPKVDWVGSALSALGLGLVVYGILKASEWGWIQDSNSPITPFGLALTPFVVAAGLIVLGLFIRWSERRTRLGLDPLFRLGLLDIGPFVAGLKMFFAQNLILMGGLLLDPSLPPDCARIQCSRDRNQDAPGLRHHVHHVVRRCSHEPEMESADNHPGPVCGSFSLPLSY